MDKQIIIATGYMGSGSSAVTDFLMEFEGLNTCNGDFEYIFMHCPNGIFDLEDKLLHGNNAIRSDEAIRSFKNQMQNLYSLRNFWPGMYKKYVSSKFMSLVDEFIDSIVQVTIKGGYWYYTEMPDSIGMQIKHFFRRAIRKISNKKIILKMPVRYEEVFISIPTEEEFYFAAKRFLTKFFEFFDGDKLVLDQFILPHNLHKAEKYLDNTKVIVVERDPRDVFYLNKYIWHKKGMAIPYPIEVNDFCEHYVRMRKNEKILNNDSILRINFEDLIFEYKETISKIIEHIGLTEEEHIKKLSKFNPEVSINNTRLFERYNGEKLECEIISERLKEYLYDFNKKSSFLDVSDRSKVF